jgi:glucokinase
MKSPSIVIGADIGGSHITAAPVDLSSKQLITASLVRLHVNSLATAEEVIDTWAQCIKQAMQQTQCKKVCLAMPGPFDYAAGICFISDQNKYPLLYGLNVKELLSPVLEVAVADIHINNDAACFLQGEVFNGSLTGYQHAVSVTLGTGLGTAVYENGAAKSADLWNMPFQDSMAEDYLSTRWFVKQYAAITGQQINGVRELAGLAMANSLVKGLFNEFGKNLALFLHRFTESTGAKAVVIGGNIAQSYSLFKDALLTELGNRNTNVFITASTLGELAAVIGAGSFCSRQSATI